MIKFKLLSPSTILPTRAHPDDAGLDLYLPKLFRFWPRQVRLIPLGIASEFPPGFVILVKDRSSMAARNFHVLGGVIDSNYRGEWSLILANLNDEDTALHAGDKVAQALLLPCHRPTPERVEELSPSDRGPSGFGSTGV